MEVDSIPSIFRNSRTEDEGHGVPVWHILFRLRVIHVSIKLAWDWLTGDSTELASPIQGRMA